MEQRLNLHIDEAGQQDLSEGLYLVAIVFHDHSADIEAPVRAYEDRLRQAGLGDIPFHDKDLLHGNDAFAKVSADRAACGRMIRAERVPVVFAFCPRCVRDAPPAIAIMKTRLFLTFFYSYERFQFERRTLAGRPIFPTWGFSLIERAEARKADNNRAYGEKNVKNGV